MKKTLLYSLAVLASVTLASCNGDYDDWAQPQHNPQEEAITIPGFTATPVVQSIDCSSVTTDSVSTFTLSEAALPEGFTLDNARLEIIPQGEDNAIKKNVNASIEGKSAVADLSEVIVSYYGKRPIAHSFVAHVYLNAVKNGDAVLIDAGKFNLEMTPKSPFIDSGYYLVGDMFNAEGVDGWNTVSEKQAFKHSARDVYDDPVFTITFETKEANQYWKIIPKKNIDAGTFWADGVVGPKENGSDSKEGDLTNVGPGAGMIKEPGKYMLTLNMMDYSYTIKPVPELYMKGDANGRNGYDYLAGDDGVHFTGFMYLNQNGFKFTTAPDWSGTGYGENFSTAPNADNIVITEPAGYYKVEVDLSEKTYTLTPITTIGIIGDATVNGWSGDDIDMVYVPYNKETKEGRYWEVKDIKLKAGEIKFRTNDGWDISWGGELDKLTTKNGGNITVEAGTYDIKLYAWAEGYAKCVMTKK